MAAAAAGAWQAGVTSGMDLSRGADRVLAAADKYLKERR
jgi:hypothetical protein